MTNYYSLALSLQEQKINPAEFSNEKPDFDRKKLFLVTYAYYLLGISNLNTRERYKTVIDQFTKFLVNTTGKTPLDAIGVDVSLWREDLVRSGGVAGAPYGANLDRYYPLEKSTVHHKLSVLSAFYEFLQRPGLNGSPPLVTYNPVKALTHRFKLEKYASSKKISVETFQKIISQINRNTVKGARDYALIYGYFMTGRRNSEWLRLRWGQINFNTDPITYSCTRKGDKKTNDELPQSLLEAIIDYLIKRYGEDFESEVLSDTYLFTALPGKGGKRQQQDPNSPLTERSMLRIVKTLARKAGIDTKTITVHSLRHLHAESYLELGASVEEVRARLQHQSLATTQRYVSSMTNEKNRLADKLDSLIKKEKQF